MHMTPIIDKKGKKAQSIALLLFVVILFIAMLLISEFNNIRQMEQVRDRNVNDVLSSEWNYINSLIDMNYTLAGSQSDIIKDDIVTDILTTYTNDDELLLDLGNICKSDKLINILGDSIKGVYLNDIVNDANDPFISSRKMILSDLSLDCASDERTRTFEEEAAMHFNPKLAEDALDAIVNQTQVDVFWNFAEVNSDYPWYADIKNMQNMSMYSLKALFMKYQDVRILETFEFLSTSYIFDRADILGNPIVTYYGELNTESIQLFINSGFNIVDIIESNTDASINIRDYEHQISTIKSDYEKSINYCYTIVILECLAFIITLVAIPKIQYRILDKNE